MPKKMSDTGTTQPNLSDELIERLVHEARQARKNAYAPYSRYWVGAALLAADGRIFTGCNIENETYSPTICAERVAVGAARAAGVQLGKLVAIAVAGGKETATAGEKRLLPPSPCGVCRQVLYELSSGQLTVVSALPEGDERKRWTIKELLPDAFVGQV